MSARDWSVTLRGVAAVGAPLLALAGVAARGARVLLRARWSCTAAFPAGRHVCGGSSAQPSGADREAFTRLLVASAVFEAAALADEGDLPAMRALLTGLLEALDIRLPAVEAAARERRTAMAKGDAAFAAIGKALGLPETATNAEILAKFDEANGRVRDRLVAEAVDAGRILEGERDAWRATLDREGVKAERLLAQLAPAVKPGAAPAHGPGLQTIIDHVRGRRTS